MRNQKRVNVVAAVIKHSKEILVVQRGAGKFEYLSGKFEFPGGKIEQGESPEEALVREIREELLLEIEVVGHLMTIEHQYPDFQINMQCFECVSEDRNITLTEHTGHHWLPVSQLNTLDWAAADVPAVNKLMCVLV